MSERQVEVLVPGGGMTTLAPSSLYITKDDTELRARLVFYSHLEHTDIFDRSVQDGRAGRTERGQDAVR